MRCLMQQTTNLVDVWSDAVRRGDSERLIDLYHPHVLVETPFGRWHGVQEIAAVARQLLEHRWRDHEIVARHDGADRCAVLSVHGAILIHHTFQFVDGQIRAHRMEVATA